MKDNKQTEHLPSQDEAEDIITAANRHPNDADTQDLLETRIRKPDDSSPNGAKRTDGNTATITLYVAGRQGPITFHNENKILLGRTDPSTDIYPALDFTTDRGAQLGVSRRHAEIVLVDKQYYIKDLQSTNGTWVNSKQLDSGQFFPLKSGDQVHLGKLPLFLLW